MQLERSGRVRNRRRDEGKQGAAYWASVSGLYNGGEKAMVAKPKAKMSLHSHLTMKCLGCCLRAAGPKANTAHSSEQWFHEQMNSLKGITNFNDRKNAAWSTRNQKRHTTSQVLCVKPCLRLSDRMTEETEHWKVTALSNTTGVVFSLNNTTKLDEGHVTNKNRIPCIGPTTQASGWDWGHVGESGQHDITLSDLWHTDGPWLTWVMSGGGIASRMGKLWTVTGHGGS